MVTPDYQKEKQTVSNMDCCQHKARQLLQKIYGEEFDCDGFTYAYSVNLPALDFSAKLQEKLKRITKQGAD